MRTGILGGTFNPVHNAHLMLAAEAKRKLKLDRIIFIPVNMPPHKNRSGIAESGHRLKMLKLALGEKPGYEVSDMELRRSGVSYTVDTLERLKKQFPADRFFIIIGSDLVADIDTWKDYRRLKKLAVFAVAQRPGYPAKRGMPAKTVHFPVRAMEICSQEIRRLIRQKQDVEFLLPARVFSYIRRFGLYS